MKRKLSALEKNSFPKADAVAIFRDYETLKSENISLQRKIDKLQAKDKNYMIIKVDKSIAPTEQKKKFKPSDLSKQELEDCMNFYIENHVPKR
ncbi:MAG: hypothetical protein ACK5KP_04515 [Paludibacteraceae bacterium]